ncbi:hypothetical protein F4780DRAFT_785581 [Xylariomycetidae sp. FL0641]|nr:hypothetical protein F4780DRAFT_785581 [Xylariomycetidae sp. FL0641]
MNSAVYLGVWTNWSRGPILGATVTTTKSTGNLLIAFTAVFITLVATRFWRIASLVLHRSYSRSEPRDALHYQRQVVLRNSATPESVIISALRMIWVWRVPQSMSCLVRLLPTVLIATLCLAGFTIAGGFSSSITTATTDQVLVRSDTCGPIRTTTENINMTALLLSHWAGKLNDATSYAQQCYSQDSSGTLGCNKFVAKRLPTPTVNTAADCPFADHLCQGGAQSALRLDTGYIDSHGHLGVNAPAKERFALRMVTTCAPLVTEGYTSQVVKDGLNWTRFHYGNVTQSPAFEARADYIHEVKNLDSQYFRTSEIVSNYNYMVTDFRPYDVEMQGGEVVNGDFLPLPDLTPSSGDLSVTFLSGNGVRFFEKMDDPWYRATQFSDNLTNFYGGGIETHSFYRPNIPASPLGCTEEYQWCNSEYPRDRGCGPLGSYQDALVGSVPFFNLTLGDIEPDRPLISQNKVGARYVWSQMIFAGYTPTVDSVVAYLGPRSLASQPRLSYGIQYALPLDQWQLDVTQFVEAAQGTGDLDDYQALQSPPVNEVERDLCNNQKIRDSAYTSFSILGLSLTFGLGGLIVCISLLLEPFLAFLNKLGKYNSYSYLEWKCNTSLQLYRLAQEESGVRDWSNCVGEVPITKGNPNLAKLDITNPKHPVLQRPIAIEAATKPEQQAQQSEEERQESEPPHLRPRQHLPGSERLARPQHTHPLNLRPPNLRRQNPQLRGEALVPVAGINRGLIQRFRHAAAPRPLGQLPARVAVPRLPPRWQQPGPARRRAARRNRRSPPPGSGSRRRHPSNLDASAARSRYASISRAYTSNASGRACR